MSADSVVLVDDIETCRAAVEKLLNEEEVAIDIEGVELGRAPGRICIIQARGQRSSTVYLFDITVLRDAAFEEGELGRLFEDPAVTKLFFDVRSDTDALFHNHKVHVQGAYDVQVLYHLKFLGPRRKFLIGLKTVMGEFGRMELSAEELHQLEELKECGVKLFVPELGGSFEVWEQRPLPSLLVMYCSADVKYLLGMKALWETKASLREHVLNITAKRLAAFISRPFVDRESKKQVDFKIPVGVTPDLPEGMVEELVPIVAGAAGRVIGRAGAKIKSIEASSGASVSMQDRAGGGKVARCVGTKSQVASAARQVRNAMV